MIHHNRLGLVTSGLVMAAAVITAAQTSSADAIFEFESFTVTGSITFDDDFEDDLRDSLPTSLLVDQADGTATVEEGGALVLSDSDGSADTFIGSAILRADTVSLESMPITNSGSGSTTVTGSVMRTFVAPTELQTTQFAGVQFGSTTDSDVTTLGVRLTDHSVAIVWLEIVAGVRVFLGSDSFTRDDTTGDIVLELSLDQSTDSAVARYSLDGGSTFVEQGDWESPPLTGRFDFDQDLFAQLMASAETVPEPSASLLGAASLAVLSLLARIRNASAQRGRRSGPFCRASTGWASAVV